MRAGLCAFVLSWLALWIACRRGADPESTRTWVGHGVRLELPARFSVVATPSPSGQALGAHGGTLSPATSLTSLVVAWRAAASPGSRPGSQPGSQPGSPIDFADPDEPTALNIESATAEAPRLPSLGTALALGRRLRHGPSYAAEASQLVDWAAGRVWLRTRFSHRLTARDGSGERVVYAIEYTLVQDRRSYTLTFSGARDAAAVQRFADRIAPGITLLSANPSRPLWSEQTTSVQSNSLPASVASAMDAVVMVLAGDIRDGQLDLAATGSGTIVSADGAILSNLHVIRDEHARQLHDVFVIARYQGARREVGFSCIGRPVATDIDEAADLALLRCEVDMDGKPWSASSLPVMDMDMDMDMDMALAVGDALYIVGFPESVHGSLVCLPGVVIGDDAGSIGARASEPAYLRTNAKISPGVSGGAALDATGRWVGVPTAYRYQTHVSRASQGRSSVEIETVGLVLPAARARALVQR